MPNDTQPHCDMCAGALPWKPFRGIAYHASVVCCTPACLERLRHVWAPTPRYPLAGWWLCGVMLLLGLIATL